MWRAPVCRHWRSLASCRTTEPGRGRRPARGSCVPWFRVGDRDPRAPHASSPSAPAVEHAPARHGQPAYAKRRRKPRVYTAAVGCLAPFITGSIAGVVDGTRRRERGGEEDQAALVAEYIYMWHRRRRFARYDGAFLNTKRQFNTLTTLQGKEKKIHIFSRRIAKTACFSCKTRQHIRRWIKSAIRVNSLS